MDEFDPIDSCDLECTGCGARYDSRFECDAESPCMSCGEELEGI